MEVAMPEVKLDLSKTLANKIMERFNWTGTLATQVMALIEQSLEEKGPSRQVTQGPVIPQPSASVGTLRASNGGADV
jgi:hypothetical protein